MCWYNPEKLLWERGCLLHHANHQVTNHVAQQNEKTVCQSLFLIKNRVGELCKPSQLCPTQLSFL